MYDVHIYEKNKNLQLDTVKYFLGKYFDLIRLRENNDDKILDVGMGDGEATVEVLFKRFSNKNETIVGCDKNSETLNYTMDKYKNYENVKFILLDIETKTLPNDIVGTFDHAFSFFCLNWISDLEQAAKNFHDLLKSAGDLFVLTVSRSSIFQSYIDLSMGDSKWAKHLKELPRHVPLYHYIERPERHFKELLINAGFDVIKCENYDREHVYDNVKEFKMLLDTLNPIKRDLPSHELDDYYDHMYNVIKDKNGIELYDDGSVKFKYRAVFACAIKKNNC